MQSREDMRKQRNPGYRRKTEQRRGVKEQRPYSPKEMGDRKQREKFSPFVLTDTLSMSWLASLSF